MKGGFEGNPPSSRKESYFLSNEKKKDYIARKLRFYLLCNFFILFLTRVSDILDKIFNNIISMSTEELQDMESRIIEAAKRVFVRKGYEATKMGDIAADVGISRTAMHYYFRTKEMLFDAIFGQLMGALLPNIEMIVDEPVSCLEKFPRFIDQYLAIVQSNPSFPIFVVNEFNRDPEHLYKVILKDPERLELFRRIQDQTLEEMEKGILRKMPLVYLISTLMSLIVFPVLARDPLTNVFFEGDPRKFDAFLQERGAFIKEVLVRLLTPDQPKVMNE